jgi:hypothetical protein
MEDEIRGACRTIREDVNVYKMLVGNPEFKRPHGRTRHRWADNIEMDLNDIRRDDMDGN